ncbi:MAG: transcriptional regulator [Proteobacteria bacterium]|nr:transcriptional regulator [Pseudomonadota bacterium]
MSIQIKPGSLSDFFDSAKETAKEIDAGKKITPKNTIWVSPSDLLAILKPERTKLIQHLRGKKRSFFSELMTDMNRTPVSLNNDLKLLSKYGLIHVYKEANPGHGVRKVIELSMPKEKIEFKAEI